MSLPPAALEAWVDYEIFLHFEVADMALLAYDYMLTFLEEVEFVWKKPFSPVTLVFVITRYLPFIDNTFASIYDFVPNLSSPACKLLYRFQYWSFVVGICIAEVVLILRTIAIWHGDKRIAIFLGTLAAGIVAPVLYYIAKYLQTFTDPFEAFRSLSPAFHKLISTLPSCTAAASRDHIIIFYVLFTVSEAVVLMLTLLRAKAYRAEPFKLFKALYHDGIAFSTYLCSTNHQ